MTKQVIEIGVKCTRKYRTPTFYDITGHHERIDFSYERLEDIIKELNCLYEEYKDKFERLTIDTYTEYDNPVCHLVGTRLETDEEYASRLRCIENEKKQKESKERQEFERLKKKFESGQ